MASHISRQIWPWLRSHGLIALLLLIALMLRLHQLGKASLWFDERGSVISAEGHLAQSLQLPHGQVMAWPDLFSPAHAGSLRDVWHTPDIHPPLYPLLLRVWRNVLGDNDVQTRGISVASSLVAMLFLYDLGLTLFDKKTSVWACAIMAVAEPQIQYAQEARSYALLTMLGLAASAMLGRLIVRGPHRGVALGLSVALLAMMLTHYFAIGPIAGLATWGAFYLRGKARRQALAAAMAATVLFLLLMHGELFSKPQAIGEQTSWLVESREGHLAKTAWRTALLPARFLCEPRANAEQWAIIGSVLFVLPFLVRKSPGLQWCGWYLLSGVGLVVGVDLIKSTFSLGFPRYTVVAAPAVYLAVAALLGKHRLAPLLPIVAIAGCLLALPDAYDNTWKGEWRELAGDVRSAVAPGDLMVIVRADQQLLADPAGEFEGIDCYAPILPCSVILLDAKPDTTLLKQMARFPHIWLVTATSYYSPGDYLPGWVCKMHGPTRLLSGQLYSATPPPVTQ